MIFFPAIDLKDGACVRLVKGDAAKATVYGDNPAAQAKLFENAGCEWIHVVDLNGAFEGRPVNGDAVDKILKAVSIPIELGGGIREMKTLDTWLEKGVRRVVLGTAALKDPKFVTSACRKYPDRIAVGLDAKNGKVAIEGWTRVSEISAIELAKQFENSGVAAIIYTDIERDGVMSGLNIEATLELARSISIPVIASGGLSSLNNLKEIKIHGKNLIEGVISGRAIYDGTIDLAEAAALLRGCG